MGVRELCDYVDSKAIVGLVHIVREAILHDEELSVVDKMLVATVLEILKRLIDNEMHKLRILCVEKASTIERGD